MPQKKTEKKIKFSGRSGMVIALGVVAYVIVSILSFGESKDADLREKVKAELRNELAGMVSQAQKDYDPMDEASARAYLEATNVDKIDIHSIKVSKPLLSLSSNQKAIVRVEFQLPGEGQERRIKFFEFRHSWVGGWTGGLTSSSFAFYSNFF